jgi:DNA polymerase III alpha subunit
MAGAVIHSPCVNMSEHLTTLYGNDIYIGFIHIQNLDEKIAKEITIERARNGIYKSLEDFINRVPVGIEAAEILIFVGAFAFTGKPKNELILVARMMLANYKPEDKSPMLIQEPVKEYQLPKLTRSPFEDAFDEIELLGFPASCTPFDLLQTKYRGNVKTSDLVNLDKQTVKMLGYLICRKHVPTKQGLMNFGTWIDPDGNYFDTTHFANCLKAYPFHGGGCYLLQGRVDVDFGFPSLVIEKMAKLPFIADPRYEDDKEKKFKIHQTIQEDVSTTHRAPYPSENEIGLPRHKMS